MQGPKGTYDVLPGDQLLRRKVIEQAEAIFGAAVYGRINTPAFEETELFVRGVGKSSDIVRKEMYTFEDKGGRSLTLKPEGTAPVVRAYVQHGMHKLPQPVKLWYYERMYRFERPQAGRFREHYQLGAEAIGSSEPALDAELIMMLSELYESLGVPEVELRLSSMGDSSCRPAYIEKLKGYLEGISGELCHDCQERTKLNPLRVFDCKNSACASLLADAPKLIDNLCDSCQEHFDAVRGFLDLFDRNYRIDGTLVRGFDYYTRTTFEYECARLGAQKGIGGGGRYDNLVEEVGGQPTPAAGFGTGLERIVLALESAGVTGQEMGVDVFFIILSSEAREAAALAMHRMRGVGIAADADYAGRSAKGQMKQANRLNARFAVIIGEDEIALGVATVKDMGTSGQEQVKMDVLLDYLQERVNS
ncbi:MAG: histidine--tRNA ligase [Thermoleophilia bacterium]|nr:histidine--tRNA ligase [Thermoleophilia bacterium]